MQQNQKYDLFLFHTLLLLRQNKPKANLFHFENLPSDLWRHLSTFIRLCGCVLLEVCERWGLCRPTINPVIFQQMWGGTRGLMGAAAHAFGCDRPVVPAEWMSYFMCLWGAAVQPPAAPDEPQRTKRQAISAEPTALDPSQLTDVTLTSYCKSKEWAQHTHTLTHTLVDEPPFWPCPVFVGLTSWSRGL